MPTLVKRIWISLAGKGRENHDGGLTLIRDVPFFESLHEDPRFAALVAYAKERAVGPRHWSSSLGEATAARDTQADAPQPFRNPLSHQLGSDYAS